MNLKQLSAHAVAVADHGQPRAERLSRGQRGNAPARRRRRQAPRLPAQSERAAAGHRQGRHDRLRHADRRQRRHRPAFRRVPVRPRRLRPRARARPGAVADRGRRGGDDLSPHRRQQAGRRDLRVVAAAGRPAHRAAQPARHPLSSCMAAPRGSISTIPISTSTTRRPSTTPRGCWCSSAIAASR